MPKDEKSKKVAYISGAVVCWIIFVLYILSAFTEVGVWKLVHLGLGGLFLAGGIKLFKRRKTV